MKKLLLAVLLLLIPAFAFADEDAQLSWDDVPLADEFHVQRKLEACPLPDAAVWVDIAQTAKGVVTYTDPNVGGGLVTCYRVSASGLNRVAESDWSNRAEKTVPFNAPANLQVQ